MLYENSGERNDAYISYYKALKAYEENSKYYNFAIPEELIISCKRLAYELGFNDDLKEFNDKYKNIPQPIDTSSQSYCCWQSCDVGCYCNNWCI